MAFHALDLFAGCGGISAGLQATGRFRSVGAVEIDADAAETYEANFGHGVDNAPIESVVDFPDADIVVGGPPCQGFSLLNRRGVGWERRGLWREYTRVLESVQPSLFVMENVPQLLSSPEFAEFERAVAGRYILTSKIVNLADYGVPQRRRRVFVIGSADRRFEMPMPSHRDPRTPDDGRRPWVTFREAVAGLPAVPNGDNWHRVRNPRPESLVRYRAVPSDGGDRFAMQANLDEAGLGHLVPRCWREKPTGTTDVFGRLWWDRPALTIRTEFFKPEKGRYLHPEEHRPITLREGARLMTFPDSFLFPAHQSMTSVARQIGNAVPPRMAEALGGALASFLAAQQGSSSGVHEIVDGQNEPVFVELDRVPAIA